MRWIYGEIQGVAKGYNQREGFDYQDTFSPIAKMVTIRTVLALASMHNWPLYQMDVDNTFLQGHLREEVSMTIPQGFNRRGHNKVCQLLKSLYGLNQSFKALKFKVYR